MSASNGDGKRLSVFVVDDSKFVHELFKGLLPRINGVDIACSAYDVPEAIELLGKISADVVILDMRMPSGSGLDVLEYVKKEFPHIKVIVFTSFPSMYIEHRSKTLGADYFFDKATDIDRVLSVLTDLSGEVPETRA